MRIKGTVFDASTGEILAGTSVNVIDRNGNVLRFGTATNDDGYYDLSLPELDDPYARVRFTHVGYTTEEMSASGANGDIFMGKSGDAMATVYVVFKKKAKDGTLGTLIAVAITVSVAKYFKLI